MDHKGQDLSEIANATSS